MTPERIKTLKAQVEAHYKGKNRGELINDIANMSAVLEEQYTLLNQLYDTKESALAVAQSAINLLFQDKEQVEVPADFIEKINAMKLSNMNAEGFIRTGAFQYGAAGSVKEQARNAINARHNKEGGSRDAMEQLRAIWAQGNFSTRGDCAEQERGKFKGVKGKELSLSQAIKYLRNTPDPDPWPADPKRKGGNT